LYALLLIKKLKDNKRKKRKKWETKHLLCMLPLFLYHMNGPLSLGNGNILNPKAAGGGPQKLTGK